MSRPFGCFYVHPACNEVVMPISVAPVAITNRGDYTRFQAACWGFLVFMMERDPRVMQTWHQWMRRQPLAPWVARRWTEAPVSNETIDGLMAAIFRADDPDDLAWFERVVYDDLQIPYGWLPAYLRQGFRRWTGKHLHLPVPDAVLLEVPLSPDFPVGHGPQRGPHGVLAENVFRYVGWLYQTRYWPVRWTKPDGSTIAMRSSIKPLAKDWARVSGRPNQDLRWEVKQGIKHAEGWLTLPRW